MIVGDEEAVEFGEMHPPQQVRVVGGVRATVVGDADHVRVHPADDLDRPFRLRGRPERRGGDEVGGALQPAPRIAAVVGVLGHPGHGQRMQ